MEEALQQSYNRAQVCADKGQRWDSTQTQQGSWEGIYSQGQGGGK